LLSDIKVIPFVLQYGIEVNAISQQSFLKEKTEQKRLEKN
jgi:hypothetical protein